MSDAPHDPAIVPGGAAIRPALRSAPRGRPDHGSGAAGSDGGWGWPERRMPTAHPRMWVSRRQILAFEMAVSLSAARPRNVTESGSFAPRHTAATATARTRPRLRQGDWTSEWANTVTVAVSAAGD
jgi:hypothetical protein